MMHVPSAAAKIWWPCSRLVHSLTTQDFFGFLPKVLTSCRSLARRGQPCIMSALTASQLFRIQLLGTQSTQTKLWMTSSCRSSFSYTLNILSLLFKGANFICLKLWAFSGAAQPWKIWKCLPSGWFGSFIWNPLALLLMSVCWFNVVV